jgi:hypothetical protein
LGIFSIGFVAMRLIIFLLAALLAVSLFIGLRIAQRSECEQRFERLDRAMMETQGFAATSVPNK